MSYIRFQTGLRCRSTGRSLGIFFAAGQLQDEEQVKPYFDESLRATLNWFNKNLRAPRQDEIPTQCLFWFDCSSPRVISTVWELVTLLRQHDVYVMYRRSTDPGKIVYRDAHQIAAIPNQRVHRVLRI